MAWIESHTVLLRHRKVLFAAMDLQIKPVVMIGHLHALWHTALEQQEDGDLTDWPDQMIADAAAWERDASEFVATLQRRGWLDDRKFHDWLDYTGKFLISKYSSGKVEKLKEIWLKHGYKYGKGQGKYAKQKATSKRQVSDKKATIPNLTSSSSLLLKKEEFEEEERTPPPPLQGGAATTFEKVVEHWNAIPGVSRCAGKPTGFISERIRRQLLLHPDWDWWVGYFREIASSDFLCGRTSDFQATLDWVLGPKNMAKVANGNYRNKSSPMSARTNVTAVCQTRVQQGLQLKPCGKPATAVIGKRLVCEAHKEEHDARQKVDPAPAGSGDGTGGLGRVVAGAHV